MQIVLYCTPHPRYSTQEWVRLFSFVSIQHSVLFDRLIISLALQAGTFCCFEHFSNECLSWLPSAQVKDLLTRSGTDNDLTSYLALPQHSLVVIRYSMCSTSPSNLCVGASKVLHTMEREMAIALKYLMVHHQVRCFYVKKSLPTGKYKSNNERQWKRVELDCNGAMNLVQQWSIWSIRS